MPTFHNKLVRDLIPEFIQSTGATCQVEVLSPPEYEQALRQKLVEEAQEAAAAASLDQLIQEIADVREVLDALMLAHQISENTVAEAQVQKRQARGSFQKRLKLIQTESQTP